MSKKIRRVPVVLDAADLFYKGNNRNIIKQLQLLNNETLKVQKLEVPH